MKRAMTWCLGLSLIGLGCDDGGSDGVGGDAGVPDAAMGSGAWADLDQMGRGMYMATVVVPAMQPIFAAYDDQYATEFTCATCHGSDLESFSMPSDIAPLSGAELSSFTFEGEGRQEIANAMAATVVPKMAELLGQEPFNPETNTGTFGCANCHAIQ